MVAPGKRRGQCHFGTPEARPGKTRTFPSFHQFSTVQPSFDHGGPVTNGPEEGARAPDSNWGVMFMIIAMRGWWHDFQSRRRHRQDIRAFQRLMDARDARRAIH
jgi:hypothetical protein